MYKQMCTMMSDIRFWNVFVVLILSVASATEITSLQNRDAELQWNITSQGATQPIKIVHPSGKNMFIVLGRQAYDSDRGFNGRWNFTGDTTTGNIDFVLAAVTKADIGTYSSISGSTRLGGVTLFVYAAVNSSLENEDMELQWNIEPQSTAQPIVIVHPSNKNMFIVLGGKVYDTGGGFKGRYSFTGNTTTGDIDFILSAVTRSDAGIYSSVAGSTKLGGVKLVVYIKPDAASIAHSVPVVGMDLVLNCTSQSNSVPADNDLLMTYTWLFNGSDLPENDRFLTINQQLTIKDIQMSDKGSKITCKAEETPVLPSDSSPHYTVEPEYKPLNMRLNSSTTSFSPVLRSRFGPIDCSAECKPPCIYQWSYNGSSINPASGVLVIPRIQREQSGRYTCTASNKHGDKSVSIAVTVSFSPIIIRFDSRPTGPYVEENRTVHFICETEGYPVPIVTIYFEGNSTVFKQDLILSTTLMLKNITCLLSGYYFCNAINEVGNVTMKASLNVLCPPRLDYRKEIEVDHGIKNYGNLNLTGSFIANPQPRFTWKFKENDSQVDRILKNGTDSFYYINQQNDYISYGSRAILNVTGEEHFGQYILEANNTIGSAILVQRVYPRRPPDSPIGVIAVCTSINTAEVVWISKYNGGAVQHFHIGVKTTNDAIYSKREKILDPGENKIVRGLVNGLEDYTGYTFTVYAKTKYGTSLLPETLECVTPGKVSCQAEVTITSIVLIVLSTVLITSFVTGVSILWFLRRRKNNRKDRHERSQKGAIKEQKGLDSINAYQDLGEREQPADTPYQELQEFRAGSAPSYKKNIYQVLREKDTGTDNQYQQLETTNLGTKQDSKKGNIYDALGQQNPPNVYDEIKAHAK